jgi:hypothetical protein
MCKCELDSVSLIVRESMHVTGSRLVGLGTSQIAPTNRDISAFDPSYTPTAINLAIDDHSQDVSNNS